jgi:hypothetical protein
LYDLTTGSRLRVAAEFNERTIIIIIIIVIIDCGQQGPAFFDSWSWA